MSEILSQHLIQLNEHIRAMADIYWNWYAFFWTLNGALLGWIYVKKSDRGIDAKSRRLIAFVFIYINIISVAASIGVAVYLWSMSHETVDVTLEIARINGGMTPLQRELLSSPTYPLPVGIGALSFNVITLSLLAGVWNHLRKNDAK